MIKGLSCTLNALSVVEVGIARSAPAAPATIGQVRAVYLRETGDSLHSAGGAIFQDQWPAELLGMADDLLSAIERHICRGPLFSGNVIHIQGVEDLHGILTPPEEAP